jgi:multiple sugar transport system ATP-binding protein
MADVIVDRISKRFGSTQVLREVSLQIRDGEFMTLLGPSGCGKSTLLRVVAGLEPQDSGSIAIGSENVDDRVPKTRDVAMVFQSYALYPYMTIRENMALPLIMRRMNSFQRLPLIGRFFPGSAVLRREIQSSVEGVAHSLAMGDLLHRKPAQLSGGQRQRAALGRAMVRDPKVFLMDEPLSNLDAKLRVHMRAELADLHRRLGTTFIYVTHDQSEAMTMSDRVAVMMEGEILQVAAPGMLYNDPVDLRVAEFVGSPKINVVPGLVATEGTVRALDGLIAISAEAPGGTPVQIGMRSENISIGSADAASVFTGSIKHIENLGSDCFVHVTIPGMEAPLLARIQGNRANEFKIGEQVGVASDPDHVLLFDQSGRRVRTHVNMARVRNHG